MKKESKKSKSITERNSNDKSQDRKAIFMSNSIHWATPKKYYNKLMQQGFIDPCPLNSNEDGLKKNYKNQKIFINPPFKDLDKWCKWILKELDYNNEIILLMPSRTDTKYFHELLTRNPIITFIKGRLRFNESKLCSPFPTILLTFKPYIGYPVYNTTKSEYLQ